MFVDDIEVLYPYNKEKIMQIHDNRLIAECTSYDFKEMLERKEVKSWLKSVSAFANTEGGSFDSGLRKMRELTEKLPNFLPGKEPRYKTEASSFFTTFYNLNWGENGRIPVEEVADRVNNTLKKYPVNEEDSEKRFGVNAEKFGVTEESSVKNFGDSQKSSVKNFGDSQKSSVKQKRLGRTAQSILDLVISDGSISQDKMAEKIGVSKRAIEMQIANLKAKGLLVREGADHGGYWRIIVKP